MYDLLKNWRSVTAILFGTAIYAFGLHFFVVPNMLMEGGATGIAVLLNYAFALPLSLTTFSLNIPLFVIGWKQLGKSQMIYTLIGIIALSVFLAVIEQLISKKWIVPFQSGDTMLAALYAGVTLGAGLGIVFRFGGTTGGIDIIARILSRKRGYSIGQIILAFDAVIILSSLLYISIEKVLYTLATVFIASKIIDYLQDGAYSAKAFSIISEHSGPISEDISRELERGVTLFPAKGAYSKQQKEVVYCVVPRQETRHLKEIVRRHDPHAFIIINEVDDVLGEGFKEE